MKANRWLLVAALVLTMGMSASAFAQAQGGGGRGQNNGGRQRGNFDPAQMRDRYMTQIKEQLASPDEEWKLIQPRLEKVLNAQRESRSNRGFGGRGGRTRGNNADQANNQPQSAVAQASEDLRKAVEDKSTSPEDLNKKIANLREAREKAKADLAAAQKELRELLSARQEATLISNGILD